MPPAERAPSPLSTAECVGVNLALLACLLVLWAFSFPSTNEAPGAVHSGTGSVGRAFEARGWEVTSLDSNPKARPSICCDILQWDYKAFEPGHFDMVWASPYCTEFSIALKKRPRNLPVGDALVLKTFEIIDYLKPRWWAIENPSTGRLKTRPYMQGLHMDRGHVLQVRLPLQEAHGGVAQPALDALPWPLLRGLRRHPPPGGRAARAHQRAAGEQLAGPALLHPACAVRRDRRERNAWGKWGMPAAVPNAASPNSASALGPSAAAAAASAAPAAASAVEAKPSVASASATCSLMNCSMSRAAALSTSWARWPARSRSGSTSEGRPILCGGATSSGGGARPSGVRGMRRFRSIQLRPLRAAL